MHTRGWAHICFIPPFDEQGNYETFYGHIVDELTKNVFGLKGQRLEYDDPDRNDCTDQQVFYRLVISDYNEDNQTTYSIVIRREMHNDMATLETCSADDEPFEQAGLSFHFEPTRLLVDDKAYQHCGKYLPSLLQQEDGNEDNWLVCLGSAEFTL